jgi:hypothetical protein
VPRFRFHSRSLGTATLTASVTRAGREPDRHCYGQHHGRAGAPSDPRLTVSCVSNTVPVNILNLDPFIGSPYLTECTVTWRNIDGTLVGDGRQGPGVDQSGQSDRRLHHPGRPRTPEDEFITRIRPGPVDVVAGKATFFFNSFNLPATAVITVTAIDNQTSETLAAQQTITIVSGAPNVPASIATDLQRTAGLRAGRGGNTSA